MDKFWELVSGALALQPEVFQQINSLPRGEIVALIVVLAAGLSQTIGQCIVLFINRVKPIRFVFSILVSTVLFACTYGFWAVSIWLVSHFVFRADPDLLTIARTLGLSYTPQIFGFLVALPHIGIPISVLLSIWSLLAIVIGFNALTGFGIWTTLACTGLGWVVLQLLQRTVGRPVAALGQSLMNLVAGTRLVSDREEIAELVMSAWQPASSLSNIPGWMQSVSQPATKPNKIPTPVKLLAIALVTFSIVLSVSAAMQKDVSIWYATLSTTYRVVMDLVSVSLLAMGFAIVLTPLEALSWWAGWYGDEEIEYHGSLVEEISDRTNIARYVLYLDGINQGTYAYLDEVDHFLDELAEALPDNILILKGIMPYSVINRPLTENRPLAFLWRAIDSAVLKNPNHPLGVFINIRNVVAVAVSADPRYGPIQNQGLAQVLFDCLVNYGYSCDRKTPITLIGFSGGAQMAVGVVPFLRRATGAPIEVISISGVISGNTGEMEVERLYHLVGKRDIVEKLGPLLFPDRWALYFLSHWNQAKRRGKISFLSLGPVGHNGAGGPFWADTQLPDGRSHLQHTLEVAIGILLKDWTLTGIDPTGGEQISNYERYKQAVFNQPSHYPIQPVAPGVKLGDRTQYYQPIGTWMGRLILPHQEDRPIPRKVLFEIYHADEAHSELIGQVVWLGWSDTPEVQNYVQLVTEDVHFIDQVKVSEQQGNVHPVRLNHWQKVDPLESLAGARPEDDVIVMLPEPVIVEESGEWGVGSGRAEGVGGVEGVEGVGGVGGVEGVEGVGEVGEDAEGLQSAISNLQSPISNPASQHSVTLYISRDPIQITGRFYALVMIVEPVGDELFKVRHYNCPSEQFDGVEEVVCIPAVVADKHGVFPSSTHQIERSPLNTTGWYIYGARDAQDRFVVEAIAPRILFALQPDDIIRGEDATLNYINHEYWKDIAEQKGQTKRVLLLPENEGEEREERGEKEEGAEEAGEAREWSQQPTTNNQQPTTNNYPPLPTTSRLLLLHLYGGIGGNKPEFAPMGVFFGHFAFGVATVVQEPLTEELRFEIEYRQVYTHNTDGFIAGTNGWTRFVGDRQFGWLGSRPISEILIKFPPLTEDYDFDGNRFSPLSLLIRELDVMAARYRIGDGTGTTFVSPINSCVQDSSQALYSALQRMLAQIKLNPLIMKWLREHPDNEQTHRFKQFADLVSTLESALTPFGIVRADWQDNQPRLGRFAVETPMQTILYTLASWRSLLPRFTNDVIAMIFLQLGATLWVLRTNQINGDPEIEPIAPTDFSFRIPNVKRAEL